MVIETYTAGSCALSSIKELSKHTGPEEALISFCENELVHSSPYYKTNESKGPLACFYLFTAGPEVKEGSKGGSHHSSKTWTKYGTEFAEYLEKHKLGFVVTAGQKLNIKHHLREKSTAQAWLWNPDEKALRTWYKNNARVKHNA